MYTSDIRRTAAIYGAVTVFVIIFSAIYEHFSHGVASYYMVLAFLIPAVGGIVAVDLLYLDRMKHIKPTRAVYLAPQLTAGATCWLTFGSIFKGVLEIYGTTNHLCWIFVFVAILQLIAAAIIEIRAVKIK